MQQIRDYRVLVLQHRDYILHSPVLGGGASVIIGPPPAATSQQEGHKSAASSSCNTEGTKALLLMRGSCTAMLGPNTGARIQDSASP